MNHPSNTGKLLDGQVRKPVVSK